MTTTITGNVTADPELRFTASGTAVVSFGLAENRSWTTKQGERQESVEFYQVVAYGELAENVAESATKGTRLTVIGRLKTHKWDDKDTGAQRQRTELNATEIAASLKWATAAITKATRTAPQPTGEEPF